MPTTATSRTGHWRDYYPDIDPGVVEAIVFNPSPRRIAEVLHYALADGTLTVRKPLATADEIIAALTEEVPCSPS